MTKKVVPVADVIMLAVPPEKMDLPMTELQDQMHDIALSCVVAQFAGQRRVPIIVITNIEWLITGDPEEVEQFQPAHDCETCLSGNERGIAFLREHPDRMLAMGNIYYDEVWG